MTHATARSEARGIKIGLCKRAERKLLPEIWDICHLTPGPGTIHSWAICVSALQEKQARSYSLAALPLPTRSFPGTKSNYTSCRGRAKNRSKCILDGTACHQEWGGFSFSFLFLTLRTVLLILGTQELHPTNPSYVTAQSGLPQGNSQDDLNDSLLGISSVSILSKPCTAEPVITAGLLGYPETASLGALR